MNILYTSVQCSEKTFTQLFQNSREFPGQQAQKYNRLLAEGLSLYNNTKVYAMSAIPVTKNNYDKFFLRSADERKENLHYHYLAAVNIRRVRDLWTVVSSFLYALWAIPCRQIDMAVIDVLAAPAALGTICAARIWRRKTIGIVTDIPDILFVKGDRAYHYVSNYVIHKVDGYIFLTQQMNQFLNNRKKPYVVIEGLVDICPDKMERHSEYNTTRVILYSGAIHKRYGIQTLTEAFLDADLSNTELHIYGSGDYQEELQIICKMHENVKFFGTVLNAEIVQAQKKATLLVNPRSETEEFTKYSFPSKNMEYMLSGVPVLATILPGMPKEYGDYIYTIKDSSREGICNALKTVMEKSPQELEEKGREARAFVLREKNKKKQAEKVLLIFSKKEKKA